MAKLIFNMIAHRRSSAGRLLRRSHRWVSPGSLLAAALAVIILNAAGAVVLNPDEYGNPGGDRFDLVPDGALKGHSIAVLQFYTGEGFSFAEPLGALVQKGFDVRLWQHLPTLDEFRRELAGASQIWIISDKRRFLTEAYLAEIKRFFKRGGGLFIWGDNDPFYTDANVVLQELLGSRLTGNIPGDKIVHSQIRDNESGFLPHPLTTGLVSLYVGKTIATVRSQGALTPLVYDSAGNPVVAVFDRDGQRAIVDGGFTKLFSQWWNAAGTERFVKNAAAWLVNEQE